MAHFFHSDTNDDGLGNEVDAWVADASFLGSNIININISQCVIEYHS